MIERLSNYISGLQKTDYTYAIFLYLQNLIGGMFGLDVRGDFQINVVKVIVTEPTIASPIYLKFSLDNDGRITGSDGNSFNVFTTDLRKYLVKELYPKIPEWSKYMYEFQKSFTSIEDLYFESSRILDVDLVERSTKLMFPCQRFLINAKLTVEIYHDSGLCYVYCSSLGIEKEPYLLDFELMDNIAGQILFDLLYTNDGAELIL